MKSLITVLVAGALAFAASGCSDPCGDLQEKCDSCGNAISKASCESVVNADDGDVCDAALDSGAYEGAFCL